MIRAALLASLVLVASTPLSAQAFPFSLAGGGMTVVGIVTAGGTPTIAGVMSNGWDSGTFGPVEPVVLPPELGLWWKVTVKIGRRSWVLWIGTNGGPLQGYYYTPGGASNATVLT